MVSGVFSIPLDAQGGAPTQALSSGDKPTPPLREFIAGQENELARVAAEALLARSALYNPVVFYGDQGTGKSHLTRGLMARLEMESPSTSVVVVGGADFARAYVQAIETNTLADLRQRFLKADLLLLEDLHELATRPKSQQELLFLFDAFLQQGRQVVVTTRQWPTETAGLIDGLASRLLGGLTVRLSKPKAPTRLALLEALSRRHDVQLSPQAIDLLVDGLSGTAMELNHTVVQLAALHSDAGPGNAGPIDEQAVRRFLNQKKEERRPTIAAITTRVSRYFKLTAAELKSPTRRQAVVQARGVAMFLARQFTGHSLSKIGDFFGRRDHTTVMHACRKTTSLLQTDAAVCRAVDDLSKEFNVL